MIGALIAILLSGSPISLPLAQAFIESNGDATTVSRARGGLYCGIWQTEPAAKIRADRERECRAMRNPFVGFAAYRREMAYWMKYAKGDLAAALRCYGCGNIGLHRSCNGYDVRALKLAHRIDLAIAHLQATALRRRMESGI